MMIMTMTMIMIITIIIIMMIIMSRKMKMAGNIIQLEVVLKLNCSLRVTTTTN